MLKPLFHGRLPALSPYRDGGIPCFSHNDPRRVAAGKDSCNRCHGPARAAGANVRPYGMITTLWRAQSRGAIIRKRRWGPASIWPNGWRWCSVRGCGRWGCRARTWWPLTRKTAALPTRCGPTAPRDIVKRWYLLYTHWLQDHLHETPACRSRTAPRAFWMRTVLNAPAPTNFLFSNPGWRCRRRSHPVGRACSMALRRCSCTDWRAGDISMTIPGRSGGQNPGDAGAGSVPQTGQLGHPVPADPPTRCVRCRWICRAVDPSNYYDLDLTSKKSRSNFDRTGFLHTTSWKNPDAMRDVTLTITSSKASTRSSMWHLPQRPVNWLAIAGARCRSTWLAGAQVQRPGDRPAGRCYHPHRFQQGR